ncbi:hypothetical protein CT19425_U460005 [Cupriavidus taiwanensis]|uniref:Uncharacterized protein n=1 Tax=Cupriavidus taiwanensis TaxID=164546 RepID=A0A375I601_9BURK|nr:hypothetical protein CT19425_U460005 [Cupriavidus taiwanensis]
MLSMDFHRRDRVEMFVPYYRLLGGGRIARLGIPRLHIRGGLRGNLFRQVFGQQLSLKRLSLR